MSNQNKDKISNYIEEANKLTNVFKKITNYSLAVDKFKDDFEDNHNSIEELRKRDKNQNEEIRELKYDLDNKDNEISALKSKIEDFKDTIDYWKDKFHKVIEFIRDKIFGIFENKDNDLYKNIADNLFINAIMDEKNIHVLLIKKINQEMILKDKNDN